MPLPFKTEEINLPDNREYCVLRILSLKKMQKDEKLLTDYVQIIKKVIARGHASRVPDQELNATKGQVWFLPHFQVYH